MELIFAIMKTRQFAELFFSISKIISGVFQINVFCWIIFWMSDFEPLLQIE